MPRRVAQSGPLRALEALNSLISIRRGSTSGRVICMQQTSALVNLRGKTNCIESEVVADVVGALDNRVQVSN